MCGLGSYIHVLYMGRVGNEQLYEVLEKMKITKKIQQQKITVNFGVLGFFRCLGYYKCNFPLEGKRKYRHI